MVSTILALWVVYGHHSWYCTCTETWPGANLATFLVLLNRETLCKLVLKKKHYGVLLLNLMQTSMVNDNYFFSSRNYIKRILLSVVSRYLTLPENIILFQKTATLKRRSTGIFLGISGTAINLGNVFKTRRVAPLNTKVEGLKGVWHEIFSFWFFHILVPHGSEYPLEPFKYLYKINEYIRM